MNSFDKIQIEESAEYQFSTMMQELQFLKEKIEEQQMEIQKELDELSDRNIEELFFTEIDFQDMGNGPADGMTAIGGDSLGFLSSISPLEYIQTCDRFDSRYPSMMDLETGSHVSGCEKSQRSELGAIPLGYVVRGRQCGTD